MQRVPSPRGVPKESGKFRAAGPRFKVPPRLTPKVPSRKLLRSTVFNLPAGVIPHAAALDSLTSPQTRNYTTPFGPLFVHGRPSPKHGHSEDSVGLLSHAALVRLAVADAFQRGPCWTSGWAASLSRAAAAAAIALPIQSQERVFAAAQTEILRRITACEPGEDDQAGTTLTTVDVQKKWGLFRRFVIDVTTVGDTGALLLSSDLRIRARSAEQTELDEHFNRYREFYRARPELFRHLAAFHPASNQHRSDLGHKKSPVLHRQRWTARPGDTLLVYSDGFSDLIPELVLQQASLAAYRGDNGRLSLSALLAQCERGQAADAAFNEGTRRLFDAGEMDLGNLWASPGPDWIERNEAYLRFAEAIFPVMPKQDDLTLLALEFV